MIFFPPQEVWNINHEKMLQLRSLSGTTETKESTCRQISWQTFFFWSLNIHKQACISSNSASNFLFPHSKLAVQSFTDKVTLSSDILTQESDDSIHSWKLQRNETGHPQRKLILRYNSILCIPCIKSLWWDY